MTATNKIPRKNPSTLLSKKGSGFRLPKKRSPTVKDRIDLRVDTELKNLFLKAATLSGNPNLSNFIVSTVRDRSIQLLEEHDRLILSKNDWELVLALLENPPKPNTALRKAAQSHKKLILDENRFSKK